MRRLAVKGSILTPILGLASLVFADAILVTALILMTVAITAVAIVMGPRGEPETPGGGPPAQRR